MCVRFTLLFLLIGCSEATQKPPATPDAAATTPAPVDTSGPIQCTEEELAKVDGGTSLVITFNTGANPKQYEPNCATVKVFAVVTFKGSFKQHPLEPKGGDAPNPFPLTESDQQNNELKVTMTTAGTFGYRCEFHPTQMFGAIKVVP